MRQLVYWWNNTFPIDRWFREKYKLGFNSPAHRECNVIDMYFEYVEDAVFRKMEKEREKEEKKKELFDKGIWMNEQVTNAEEEEELFNKIKLSSGNKIKVED